MPPYTLEARAFRGGKACPTSEDKMEPILISVAECQAALGIGRTAVYSLLDRELQSAKIGRRRLIVLQSVHAYVLRAQTRDQL